METDNSIELFAFHPNPEATQKRMIGEAKNLYRMGLEQVRHQPVVKSYNGLLKNFYLYLTFDCPFR